MSAQTFVVHADIWFLLKVGSHPPARGAFQGVGREWSGLEFLAVEPPPREARAALGSRPDRVPARFARRATVSQSPTLPRVTEAEAQNSDQTGPNRASTRRQRPNTKKNIAAVRCGTLNGDDQGRGQTVSLGRLRAALREISS